MVLPCSSTSATTAWAGFDLQLRASIILLQGPTHQCPNCWSTVQHVGAHGLWDNLRPLWIQQLRNIAHAAYASSVPWSSALCWHAMTLQEAATATPCCLHNCAVCIACIGLRALNIRCRLRHIASDLVLSQQAVQLDMDPRARSYSSSHSMLTQMASIAAW